MHFTLSEKKIISELKENGFLDYPINLNLDLIVKAKKPIIEMLRLSKQLGL